MQKLDQKLPFLVRFGLNLGLNNLKFDLEAISNRIDSIGSTRSDRAFGLNLCLNNLKFDQEAISNLIDSIDSTEKMPSWLNFKFFRPFLVQFFNFCNSLIASLTSILS